MSGFIKNDVSKAVSAPTACPLCGDSRLEILSEYGERQLRKCLECRVSFVFPQPSVAALRTHFEAGGIVGVDDFEAKFGTNRERVLSRVETYIEGKKKGGSILDLGCATGVFLARFSRKNQWQAWGVELSHPAAEKARQGGIRVHQGDIHHARLQDECFDVVTLLDALYYFPNPELELAACRRVLKADGLLVVELPLGDSRIWRASHGWGRLRSRSRRPLLASSDHLFYYNPRSVSLLLERSGFEVQAVLPLPGNRQPHPFRDLAYRMYWFLSSGLHAVSGSRILLGPRFLVAAVKRPPGSGKTQPLAKISQPVAV